MRLHAVLIGLSLAAAVILTQGTATSATGPSPSPDPCASPPSSGAPPTPPYGSTSPSCDSSWLDEVRRDLGSSLADALQVQTELKGSLHANIAEWQAVSTRIADVDARIVALDAEVQRLQGEIESTNRRIEVERSQIAALARTIYAQPDSLFVVLAQSSSFSDGLTRTSRIIIAGRRAEDIKAQLGEDLKRLEVDQQKAQADRDELAQKRIELQNATDALMSLQDQSMAIGDELHAVVDEIQSELSVVATQSPGVADSVRQQILADADWAIAEARQVTSDNIRLLLQVEPTNAFDGKASSQSRTPAIRDRASLAWPIRNAVLTQGFGPSPYLFEPSYGTYPHFHTGIDLAAAVNSQVLAAADGKVVLVGRDPWGYGNYVVIAHGQGLATLYGHLNAITVKYDQRLIQGQEIGLEGSTGASTGPHVHFEVRVGGVPVDPLPYLLPSST